MRAAEVTTEEREEFVEEFGEYPNCWLCGSEAPYYVMPQVAERGQEEYYPMICRVCRAHALENEEITADDECVICLDERQGDIHMQFVGERVGVCADCRDEMRQDGWHHAPADPSTIQSGL